MSDELLAAIDVKLDTLKGRLRGDIHAVMDELRGELRGEIRALDERVTDLDRHMHVLHEDTIANIKALGPDFAPIERKIKEGDDGLREEFDRRLRPLEREHRKHR